MGFPGGSGLVPLVNGFAGSSRMGWLIRVYVCSIAKTYGAVLFHGFVGFLWLGWIIGSCPAGRTESRTRDFDCPLHGMTAVYRSQVTAPPAVDIHNSFRCVLPAEVVSLAAYCSETL